MRVCVLLLAAAFTLASEPVHKSHHKRSGCQFYGFLRHDVVDAWEFQTKLPFKKLRLPFEEVAEQAFEDMKHISHTHTGSINVTVHRHTRVGKTFTQDGWSLTTYDGKGLYDDVREQHQFPWTDGYLRKRQSIYLNDPKKQYSPINDSCPYDTHNTDLTVKFRNIVLGEFDAETFTGKFPETVDDSHNVKSSLSKVVEADAYCNTGNVQFKAVYFPVSMHTPTHNLEVLSTFFPGLSDALALPACAPLPFRRSKFQREAKWDVFVNDVKVAFTLTLEYKSQAKAFTGTGKAAGGELSLKVYRKEVSDTRGVFTYQAVEDVAHVVDELHLMGWDYLKPGMDVALVEDDVDVEEQRWVDPTWGGVGLPRTE